MPRDNGVLKIRRCANFGGKTLKLAKPASNQGFWYSTLVGESVARKCYLQSGSLDLFSSASSSGGGLPGRLDSRESGARYFWPYFADSSQRAVLKAPPFSHLKVSLSLSES